MKNWIALTLGLLLTQATLADEMEISISDRLIDGSYEMFFGNNFSVDIALLHADMDNIENADIDDVKTFKEEDDGVKTDMLTAGIYANSKITNIKTHLGGKAFYLDSDYGNYVYGLALGGGLDAYVRRTCFSGEVHYAPDIITNGDFNDFWEVNTRASFQVLRNANVYVGYKFITANFDYERIKNDGSTTDGTLNRDFFDGLYVGFRFSL